MTKSDIKLFYNTALTYLQCKYGTHLLFVNKLEEFENVAINVTASLFSKDEFGSIYLNYGKNKTDNMENEQGEINFFIYAMVKKRVDDFIEFEMLKYDLIGIDEYKSTLK